MRDQQQQQQHARSLSAPAAPRRRPAAVTDHHRHGPLDVERRLLPSPPPPPSTSTPTRRDSSTGATVRCRRTFPDVELNGPAVVVEADELSATSRRPDSVSPPADNPASSSRRRRLRAARGRLNYVYASSSSSAAASACDCAVGVGLGGTLAALAIVAGTALVLSAVGVHLLLRLTAVTAAALDDASETAAADVDDDDDSLLTLRSGGGGTMTRTVVGEVAVALAAVTVALDLCCLLTLSMQCFFAVKLAHCRNADIRFIDVYIGYVTFSSVTGWRAVMF